MALRATISTSQGADEEGWGFEGVDGTVTGTRQHI